MTVILAEELSSPPESYSSLVIRRFLRHRMATFFLIILFFITLAWLFAPLWPSSPPRLDQAYSFPMTSIKGQWHLLGTDELGRDYLTQILRAGRVSLTVAGTVSIISAIIGISLGLLAGYFGGWIDAIITFILETFSTFPLLTILLIITALVSKMDFSFGLFDLFTPFLTPLMLIEDYEVKKIVPVILVLALLNWPGTARQMRGMALSVREYTYVKAARALGASDRRIMLRHIFPNAWPPLIVDFTLGLNFALVLESALSFLGYGIQNTSTWGNMLKFAVGKAYDFPWMPLIPGLPILLCSLAINYIGDGLRDALDPRLKMD